MSNVIKIAGEMAVYFGTDIWIKAGLGRGTISVSDSAKGCSGEKTAVKSGISA